MLWRGLYPVCIGGLMFLVFRSVHCIVKYRSIQMFVSFSDKNAPRPLRTREMADIARCNAHKLFFVCRSL
jgi:hypothetical protein